MCYGSFYQLITNTLEHLISWGGDQLHLPQSQSGVALSLGELRNAPGLTIRIWIRPEHFFGPSKQSVLVSEDIGGVFCLNFSVVDGVGWFVDFSLALLVPK